MKYSAKTKPRMGDPYWYEWLLDNNIPLICSILIII